MGHYKTHKIRTRIAFTRAQISNKHCQHQSHPFIFCSTVWYSAFVLFPHSFFFLRVDIKGCNLNNHRDLTQTTMPRLTEFTRASFTEIQVLPLRRLISSKLERGTKAVLSRTPLQPDSDLCFFTHGRLENRRQTRIALKPSDSK